MLADGRDTVPSFSCFISMVLRLAPLAGENDVRQVVHIFRAAATARPEHTGEIPL
jgi:hypothetical protein